MTNIPIYVVTSKNKISCQALIAYDTYEEAIEGANKRNLKAIADCRDDVYEVSEVLFITLEHPPKPEEIVHTQQDFCSLCDANLIPKVQFVIRIPCHNKTVCLECAAKISELYDKDM